MANELGDVVLALAQRRDPEVDDVEAVVEVFAELALRDQVLQVPVGGGDDAHVHAAAAPLRSHFLQLAGLEEAEQQPLHAQRHLADFVQEHRAAVSGLELAGLVAVGAGEAALHVAEELGLEECLGEACTVDRDERLLGARTVDVNGLRDELFARPALAGDEDLGIGPRDAFDLLAELEHHVALADQLGLLGSHRRRSFVRPGVQST